MRRSWLAVVVGALILSVPAPVRAADAPTCAQGYLLCLNEATQAESNRTWKELACLRAYGSCLRNQAFGT